MKKIEDVAVDRSLSFFVSRFFSGIRFRFWALFPKLHQRQIDKSVREYDNLQASKGE